MELQLHSFYITAPNGSETDFQSKSGTILLMSWKARVKDDIVTGNLCLAFEVKT